MENRLHILVYKSRSIFDNLIVTPYAVTEYAKKYNTTEEESKGTIESNYLTEHSKLIQLCLRRKGFNAYLLSAYINALKHSKKYRQSAVIVLLQFCKSHAVESDNAVILLKLCIPKQQFLDYKWNERMVQMAMERRELDYMMSWLSTFGGAYSALGDDVTYCAEVAGNISLRQFQLALRLGDPLLVAQCKLYAALSLIQRGYLKVAKRLIQNIFQFSINEKNTRLQNMCKGVWAKLQYKHKLILQVKHSQ
ncbi:uncharacterized protein LOC105702977 [Orussus abietinus]|uniref:uncharacterized protein LOC105702977 n=1 Tax=Orussus abietinus TaxID=222816 RepID=UPI0006259853|nr:uncharacterized protein LOC105702977 [Orussus abietinus]